MGRGVQWFEAMQVRGANWLKDVMMRAQEEPMDITDILTGLQDFTGGLEEAFAGFGKSFEAVTKEQVKESEKTQEGRWVGLEQVWSGIARSTVGDSSVLKTIADATKKTAKNTELITATYM